MVAGGGWIKGRDVEVYNVKKCEERDDKEQDQLLQEDSGSGWVLGCVVMAGVWMTERTRCMSIGKVTLRRDIGVMNISELKER